MTSKIFLIALLSATFLIVAQCQMNPRSSRRSTPANIPLDQASTILGEGIGLGGKAVVIASSSTTGNGENGVGKGGNGNGTGGNGTDGGPGTGYGG